MSHNPNTVKSQDELNEGGRKSDVLVEAISKLETTTKENELFKEIIKDEMIKNGERLEEIERLQKQLEIAKSYLNVIKCLRNGKCLQCVDFAYRALRKIKELNK
jgi:F0F1-type ATP synthase delta subunit